MKVVNQNTSSGPSLNPRSSGYKQSRPFATPQGGPPAPISRQSSSGKSNYGIRSNNPYANAPKSGQLLGPGLTPKGRSGVPNIPRYPPGYTSPTGGSWGRAYRRAMLGAALRATGPIGQAVGIGYDLLEGWAVGWGPSNPEIPGVPAHYEFGPDWVRCCTIGPPMNRQTTYVGVNPPPCTGTVDTYCGLSGQYLSGHQAIGTNFNTHLNGNRIILSQLMQDGVRHHIKEIWVRPRTSPLTKPSQPQWVPETAPVPGSANAGPAPVRTTPDAPAYSEARNGPRNQNQRDPYRPYAIPGATVTVTPSTSTGSGGATLNPNSPHILRPPKGPELKIKAAAAGGILGVASRIYDNVTEGGDIIDALADAIPGKPCGGKLLDKLDCVIANWDKIDPVKAAGNLLYNHYEDKLVGKGLSYGKKAPYGVMAPTRQMDRQRVGGFTRKNPNVISKF